MSELVSSQALGLTWAISLLVLRWFPLQGCEKGRDGDVGGGIGDRA
jgi:hypothetical protein